MDFVKKPKEDIQQGLDHKEKDVIFEGQFTKKRWQKIPHFEISFVALLKLINFYFLYLHSNIKLFITQF